MTLQNARQLPLWEHVVESGRFAEYATGSPARPWNLIGRAVVSCLTFLGSAADVVQVSGWQGSATPHTLSVAARSVDFQGIAPPIAEGLELDLAQVHDVHTAPGL